MPTELSEGLAQLLGTQWNDNAVVVGPLEPFGDGHSGFTYAAEIRSSHETGRYVVRLSPPGARILANADVGRQGRIMAALNAAGLPTPRVLLADSSGALQGRAVVVMELIDGVDWQAAADKHGGSWVVDAAVDVLRRLSGLRPSEVGLVDEAPLTLSDDLDRWGQLLRRAPEELHEGGQRLARALAETLPPPVVPGLVHGDFHYGNLLFDDSGVVGIVDWEIACLGDPRWDFGSLAVAAVRRKYRPEPNATGELAVSVADLANRYGGDEVAAAWFVAAACFKYVAILGYNLGLHRRGRRVDPVYEQMPATITGLAGDGMSYLERGIRAPVD